MIPNVPILTQEITETTYPGRTYKIIVNSNIDESDRINGNIDDLEAVSQAVYLILNTERYKFNIYSWDYGVELLELIGKPMPYVLSEIPRRIKEALSTDNRIKDVTDFKFEQKGKRLLVTFTVISNVGNVSTELEVEV